MPKELICIRCPLGCSLQVDEELCVSGNHCLRGRDYALQELTDPRRTVTSTVRVTGAMRPCVAVKTATDVPKGKMRDIMRALADVSVEAPVRIGDLILRDAAGTGSDIIATANLERCHPENGGNR
ncbi:MAG: DUF1667 domain-containing protein [Lachnospiraceae bacterium]|nr:DUF1667 domain-containing protein [Lachnospiraceae bacterium]MDY5742234.1 DUF1667 domain-containing protein [Lachnospiraceae bacterium]